MAHGASVFLGFCILLVQLLQLNCQHPMDPEVRAHLEAKVMSSLPMKDLEAMVERDERVLNAPKSKFIIVPKPKHGEADYTSEEMDQKAYIIQRKSKKISALFGVSDLESAGSDQVKQFYESIVQKVVNENRNQYMKDPLALLEAAASEGSLSYSPRFNYDAYAKDSTETKLKGKPYWRDAPQRREEEVDEKGCRTVVKKIIDPEDQKKNGNSEAKSVIITKECEYPNVQGPDAKLPELPTSFRVSSPSLESQPSVNYDREIPSYESSRPIELDAPKSSDPLEPDYIDRMLETHFRSFPTFSNPITSFKGYQDRFNLRTPEGFKDIKPTVNVQSYDYTHPESGFDKESDRAFKSESPIAYERQQQYEPADEAPRKVVPVYENPTTHPKFMITITITNIRKRFQEKQQALKVTMRNNKNLKAIRNIQRKKIPKMMKKSFAYYRKDNPKQDPNDQRYAEEYAQGSYRSFSSDYDSERDGPKKID
ncbi:uncharacterized protein CEXT_665661 [Caerostris extrusa]|uniref:Uncharacterized protein n=1 Tax=Caerostris extrusa TaxID=172846 RepID=A0AAV4XY84_CAEEX|nr:uncharacterized protein CEXT_665661 [Caerostris extrusa]